MNRAVVSQGRMSPWRWMVQYDINGMVSSAMVEDLAHARQWITHLSDNEPVLVTFDYFLENHLFLNTEDQLWVELILRHGP